MKTIMLHDGVPAILIPGSSSDVYAKLLKHAPKSDREERFLRHLEDATNANVQEFYVPVYGPSIDEKRQLQFIPNRYPLVGKNYEENRKFGEERGFYIGRIEHWDLFLGTLIYRLMEIEGWTMEQAFYAVCEASAPLGNYDDAHDARCRIENTGSRMIAGIADLANTKKMVTDVPETTGNSKCVYLVGGCFSDRGYFDPLASRGVEIDFQYSHVTAFFIRDKK